jgi:hypothetical protein
MTFGAPPNRSVGKNLRVVPQKLNIARKNADYPAALKTVFV